MFQLHDDGPATEELEEDIAAANHWLLPSGLCHIISINAVHQYQPFLELGHVLGYQLASTLSMHSSDSST